jgi:hypothetical protein
MSIIRKEQLTNPLTASYAFTASYAENANTSTTNTSSLLVTASVSSNVITFTKGNTDQFSITVDTGSSSTINTGSLVTTSSFNAFTASINIFTSSYNTGSFSGSFTGNFNGTASWAESSSQAITASYYKETDPIFTAVSGTFVLTSSFNSFTSSINTFTASYNTGSFTGSFSGSFYGTASWATNAQTASYVLQAISASFASNGGVTQLLAGPNITLSPTNGLGQVTITSTGGGGSSFNTATGSYGSFYDTTTQTNPVGNVPRSMSFNETDITNGVSISGSTNPFNTYIKTENAGIYNIQFSAQIEKTDSGTDVIVIWLRKNGIDLTDSATKLTLSGNGTKVVAAWNWFVSSAANDYYQIIWVSADTGMRLYAEPINDTPGIPSVILTVNRVDQFLSNTGSFTGSFTGIFTGSLFGTSSWATNALTSSFYQETDPIFVAKSASLATTGSNNFNGNQTIIGSLSQGLEGNIASGPGSHAEGSATSASGEYSHAEGDFTQATGNYSHAEGQNSMTLASAEYSHAEGNNTIAAANHQHVQGQWNVTSSIPAAFIVGNGTDDSNRSNLIYAHDSIVEITGSLGVNGGITGSLFGTASWAINALTASYVNTLYSNNFTASFGSSTTWTINHNLNTRYVIVQIFNSNHNQILPQEITLTNANTATATFSQAESGYAVVTVGGALTYNNITYTSPNDMLQMDNDSSTLHDLIYLENDDTWYPVDQSSNTSATRMLAINSGSSYALVEGYITVGEDGSASGVPLIAGSLTSGVPVYIKEGATSAPFLDTTVPTTGIVRLLGHLIRNEGSGYWLMKFRPDHTWVEI